MNNIKTIDLWTEQFENHLECFQGAFIDGLDSGTIPFDSYKVIRNCNCVITSNLKIRNKHNAIVFYKNNVPVRLLVCNRDTDVNMCIEEALKQTFNNITLKDLYNRLLVKKEDIDLNQMPIFNRVNKDEEIEIGSCDRPGLLNSMLSGSYTESDTGYGKSNTDSEFTFVPNLFIQYNLLTDNEHFVIDHHTAFVNETMTRIIPLQDNSQIDIEEIYNENVNNHSRNHR